jgi:putative nucleotidyltransferase with HDIG domain
MTALGFVEYPDVVQAALDRLAPADRTVAAKVVATRFVERCAAAAAAADWTLMSDWVETACRRYAGIMPAADVIAVAMERVASTLAGASQSPFRAAFEAARRDAEAAIARQRALPGAERHEAVDEIDVVLDDLVTRIDQSDELTAEHSRAVSSWCTRLGKRLGESAAEIVHLGRAGLIHDIGKVATPAAILRAPRALDQDEMTIMRRHAADGAAIVERMPLIVSLLPAVRNHHERFDGTGYPDRLKFETIPRVARIVAVADAFNAMIGRRPYRPPLAPSEALERLVGGRGDQFDPDIVDAMVDVVTKRT